MSRPIVLTFVGCYLPGYKSGGPVRTIANMVDHLGDDLSFRIVTADRDFLDTEPYPDVDIDQWNTVGKAQVFYASPRAQSLVNLARLVRGTPHDVLYLNSFFDPGFTLRPLLARRLGLLPRRAAVIAPRGEFSGGALALKRWKKQSYKTAARALGLYGALTWQASSEYEANDIREAMKSTAHLISVAGNLPPTHGAVGDGGHHSDRDPGGPLRVCFVSRVSPKKNLDYVLEVLRRVSVPTELLVCGIVDDETYWRRCTMLMERLPSHVAVDCLGAVPHSEVASVLAQQDLFFLPTRGENYGHAIFEALAAGLPVLISDQTPWQDLEKRGAGWALPLSSPERFGDVIEAQAGLDERERALQRTAALKYAAQVAGDKSTVDANLALFTDLLARQRR